MSPNIVVSGADWRPLLLKLGLTLLCWVLGVFVKWTDNNPLPRAVSRSNRGWRGCQPPFRAMLTQLGPWKRASGDRFLSGPRRNTRN
jgi:hypothetical protein